MQAEGEEVEHSASKQAQWNGKREGAEGNRTYK
jgi:hypothetical protein